MPEKKEKKDPRQLLAKKLRGEEEGETPLQPQPSQNPFDNPGPDDTQALSEEQSRSKARESDISLEDQEGSRPEIPPNEAVLPKPRRGRTPRKNVAANKTEEGEGEEKLVQFGSQIPETLENRLMEYLEKTKRFKYVVVTRALELYLDRAEEAQKEFEKTMSKFQI